ALIVFCAVVVAVWALVRGPLTGRLVRMDDTWLKVLAEKDYLFPNQWPLYAWAANLAYLVVIAITHFRRRGKGLASPGERAMVTGLASLTAIFLISVPFSAARIALAVQLQVTRVFWVLDFCAVAYLAWWLMESSRLSRGVQIIAIAVVAVVSGARG